MGTGLGQFIGTTQQEKRKQLAFPRSWPYSTLDTRQLHSLAFTVSLFVVVSIARWIVSRLASFLRFACYWREGSAWQDSDKRSRCDGKDEGRKTPSLAVLFPITLRALISRASPNKRDDWERVRIAHTCLTAFVKVIFATVKPSSFIFVWFPSAKLSWSSRPLSLFYIVLIETNCI